MKREEEIEGKLLPIMEEFYSLQGEGYQTGKPAYFLRVGGCDVGCFFCDVKESWDATKHTLTATDEVVRRIVQNPSKSVVVTGGEPLLYNMDYLCQALHRHQFSLFLETSGSEKLSGQWDWICLSPKKNAAPLPEIISIANELKVIIFDESDFLWAEENAKKVGPNTMLFLQPEWSNSAKMMQSIVDYALAHPRWRVSLQSHKYMRIP
ncbi:MAG: 7-carboxy-7-deazaguanine synthase QueE [Bacteroidales bacterium]|jgi:organic radical activating enzyme|nr:7-carboxy-7-deazaguanine synthase QueE [Bacteroidales bacterium]